MSQETNKIAVILSSNDHTKVQLAGMICSVAAVSGISVLLFVSMGAIRKFKKGISEDEKFSGGEFSEVMRDKVPPYLDLFKQGKEFGDVKIYACPMALEILEWTTDDLEDDVFDDVAGMTKFLVDADGHEMLHL